MRSEERILRLKRRLGGQSKVAVKPPTWKAFLTLSDLSHMSQIGLLALAFFGYFYTVKPVYTKALLEENIAKKEIELSEAGRKTKKAEAALAASNSELVAIRSSVNSEKLELHRLRDELSSVRKLVTQQEAQISRGKVDLENQYSSLRDLSLHGIRTQLLLTCYRYIENATKSTSVSQSVVDSVSACLKSSVKDISYFSVLSPEDMASITSQLDASSKRYQKHGTALIENHVSQSKTKIAHSYSHKNTVETQLEDLKERHEVVSKLMNSLSKELDTLSL